LGLRGQTRKPTDDGIVRHRAACESRLGKVPVVYFVVATETTFSHVVSLVARLVNHVEVEELTSKPRSNLLVIWESS
jgi:hypothetical protein